MPRVVRIPFYERRKPIDIVAGLAAYKQQITQEVAQGALDAVIPQATAALTAAFQEAVLSNVMSYDYVSRGGESVGISSGAGYKGGTSPAAKAILSAAAKAKSQSSAPNRSTSSKKKK